VPVKILLMTDMEGCAGVLNHDDWVMRTGQFYSQGRRLLTLEVNAALEGLFDGGATDVLVVDGHGQGGLDPELLDERAWLKRGADQPIGAWGLDESFAGLAFVGQHAKAGTPYSHLTHTQWFNYQDLAINGLSIGEYGQMALLAMTLGVPTILACGEVALADEAAALTPGVVTVAVKQGTLPDGLDHLDTNAYRCAKLSAEHRSPASARKLIREGAADAMAKLRRNARSFQSPVLRPPYVRTARFRRDGDRAPWAARDEHPSSLMELMYRPFTPIA